jgi:hypothetical protein
MLTATIKHKTHTIPVFLGVGARIEYTPNSSDYLANYLNIEIRMPSSDGIFSIHLLAS